jgi:anti-sigma regulatory factor (Ser/Thr protein kinase)
MASFRSTIRNDLAEFKGLTPRIIAFLEELAVPARATYATRVAVEELVVNVIQHGFDDAAVHEIDVGIDVEAQRIVVRIEDDGREFDPTAAPVPSLSGSVDERTSGGWGIHLVRTMSDSVEYTRRGGRNRVEVVVSLRRGRS